MDLPQPLAPHLPSADVVIVLAKARERDRYIVAVSRPFDFGRREWKLHSWPLSAVYQPLRDELERHSDQWAQLGSKGDLPHTCRPTNRATTAAADAEPTADADSDANALTTVSLRRLLLEALLLLLARGCVLPVLDQLVAWLADAVRSSAFLVRVRVRASVPTKRAQSTHWAL